MSKNNSVKDAKEEVQKNFSGMTIFLRSVFNLTVICLLNFVVTPLYKLLSSIFKRINEVSSSSKPVSDVQECIPVIDNVLENNFQDITSKESVKHKKRSNIQEKQIVTEAKSYESESFSPEIEENTQYDSNS